MQFFRLALFAGNPAQSAGLQKEIPFSGTMDLMLSASERKPKPGTLNADV